MSRFLLEDGSTFLLEDGSDLLLEEGSSGPTIAGGLWPSLSRMGNLIINPSGTTPGEIETAMRGPAWWVLDLSPLWGYPDLRGADTIIPGAAGRRANRRRIDETTYLMPLHISGLVTVAGSATAVPTLPLQGLRDNLDYLYANVVDPLATGPRQVKLVLPDGTELLAAAHCHIVLGQQNGPEIRAVLEVTVPAGRFG